MKALKLSLAWVLVAVPLGWGVYHSVRKALPLFQTAPQPAAPAPPLR